MSKTSRRSLLYIRRTVKAVTFIWNLCISFFSFSVAMFPLCTRPKQRNTYRKFRWMLLVFAAMMLFWDRFAKATLECSTYQKVRTIRSSPAMDILKWPALAERRREHAFQIAEKYIEGRCLQYFDGYFTLTTRFTRAQLDNLICFIYLP